MRGLAGRSGSWSQNRGVGGGDFQRDAGSGELAFRAERCGGCHYLGGHSTAKIQCPLSARGLCIAGCGRIRRNSDGEVDCKMGWWGDEVKGE